jgi:N-acetylglutamate synthase-like GNAT family acetyltransferase
MIQTRLAKPRDLSYIASLQDRFVRQVGYCHRQALEEKIELGRVELALENGEPAGYLHHGTIHRSELRIFQAAIQYDAQRRHLGLSLVDRVVEKVGTGVQAISLRCLDYLPANDFWKAAGFERIAREPGKRAPLNVWVRRLQEIPIQVASRLRSCVICRMPIIPIWVDGSTRRNICPQCLASVSI